MSKKSPIITRDGLIVIHRHEHMRREKLQVEGLEPINTPQSVQSIGPLSENAELRDSRVVIHARNKKNKSEEISEYLPLNNVANQILMKQCSELSDEKWKSHKKKGSLKKTINKEKARLIETRLNFEEREERPQNLMADLLRYKKNITLYDNELWIYSKQDGCYKSGTKEEILTALYSLLDESGQIKISYSELEEALKLLRIMKQIRNTEGFCFNTPLVNCLNGVFDAETKELSKHKPKYGFNHCIQANYDPDSKGPCFDQFISNVTKGDAELEKLIQEVLGYTLSMYTNAKTAFIFYGPTNTGKSVLLNLIASMFDGKSVSYVSLQQLNRTEFAVVLADSLVNITSDLPSEPLKDIGSFKSLVSKDDTKAERALYGNPRNLKGDTKMLFGSNHLIRLCLTSQEDVDAFFRRILYIPMFNQIPIEQEDKLLSEKLKQEKDYIFTWAMKGLRRYLRNGQLFSPCEQSEEVKRIHRMQINPAAEYTNKHLSFEDPDATVSTTLLVNDFLDYCSSNGIANAKAADIRSHLASLGIQHVKTRENGSNPLHRFKGVKFIE